MLDHGSVVNRTQPTTYLGLGPTTTRIAFTEVRLQGGFMVYEKAHELGTEIVEGAADLVEEVRSQARGGTLWGSEDRFEWVAVFRAFGDVVTYFKGFPQNSV